VSDDQPSLDRRVQELEQFQFKMVARANAYQQMLITLLMQILEKTTDPVRETELLLAAWHAGADQSQLFGVDPVYADALKQEYEDALREIGAFLLKAAQSAATR